MFSKKATKIDEIFTVDLTLCSKFQIDGEDFVNFCGLLRKHELYLLKVTTFPKPKVKSAFWTMLSEYFFKMKNLDSDVATSARQARQKLHPKMPT